MRGFSFAKLFFCESSHRTFALAETVVPLVLVQFDANISSLRDERLAGDSPANR